MEPKAIFGQVKQALQSLTGLNEHRDTQGLTIIQIMDLHIHLSSEIPDKEDAAAQK